LIERFVAALPTDFRAGFDARWQELEKRNLPIA